MIRTERSALGFRDHVLLPVTLQKIKILPENSWKIAKKKTEQNVQLILDFTLWTFDMWIFVVLFEGDVYVQDFGRPGTDLKKIHLFGKTHPTKMALGSPKKICCFTCFLSIAAQESTRSLNGRWRAHDWWMKSSLAQSSLWCPTRSDRSVQCVLKRHYGNLKLTEV